jgi:hypothetical protein
MSLLVFVLILALLLILAGAIGQLVPGEFKQIYYIAVLVVVVIVLINALGGIGPRVIAL